MPTGNPIKLSVDWGGGEKEERNAQKKEGKGFIPDSCGARESEIGILFHAEPCEASWLDMACMTCGIRGEVTQ